MAQFSCSPDLDLVISETSLLDNLPSPTSSDMEILFCSPETNGFLEIQPIADRPCKRAKNFGARQSSKRRKLSYDDRPEPNVNMVCYLILLFYDQ